MDLRLILQGQRAALGPGAWPDQSQRRLSTLILYAPERSSCPQGDDRGSGEEVFDAGCYRKLLDKAWTEVAFVFEGLQKT